MPALVAVAVVLPVIVLVAWRFSVVLHLFIVPPLVPSMAAIPVAVLVAKGDVADADADANATPTSPTWTPTPTPSALAGPAIAKAAPAMQGRRMRHSEFWTCSIPST